jgi:hypothetical protein
MPLSRFHYLTRRLHRWLGILIGIQFLAWTLGGLYFSWSDMDEVHGDYEKAQPALLAADGDFIFPKPALDSLRRTTLTDSLADLRLVSILGKPHWQIVFFEKGHEHHRKKIRLANAETGLLRPPLTETEAVAVAKMGYIGYGNLKSVNLLTEISTHHEYRENPLPAYAMAFDDARNSVVYVSADLGTVQKIRNTPWRGFDFLWMLHTMDYSSRDNITNWLLRVFSIFGLLTVASGFVLFFVSRKRRNHG